MTNSVLRREWAVIGSSAASSRLPVRARVGVGGRSRQPVAPEEELGERAAEDGADDEARGGARHRELHDPLDVHGLPEPPGVGRARPMPADQGDRSPEQSHHRMHVHEARRGKPDGVLRDDERDAEREEDQESRAAFGEHPRVGSEAYRGEEHQQQSVAQPQVEAEPHVEESVHDGQEQRHQAAAHDGRGDVQPREHRYVRDEEAADEQHRERQEQGRDEVELYRAHAEPPGRLAPIGIGRSYRRFPPPIGPRSYFPTRRRGASLDG
jgi:hypothetical protein